MDIAKGIRHKAEELVAARRERQAQGRKQAALQDYRQKLSKAKRFSQQKEDGQLRLQSHNAKPVSSWFELQLTIQQDIRTFAL